MVPEIFRDAVHLMQWEMSLGKFSSFVRMIQGVPPHPPADEWPDSLQAAGHATEICEIAWIEINWIIVGIKCRWWRRTGQDKQNYTRESFCRERLGSDNAIKTLEGEDCVPLKQILSSCALGTYLELRESYIHFQDNVSLEVQTAIEDYIGSKFSFEAYRDEAQR